MYSTYAAAAADPEHHPKDRSHLPFFSQPAIQPAGLGLQ